MWRVREIKRLQSVWFTLLAVLALLALSACSIEKEKSGGEEKVDIKVPFAEVHVGGDPSTQDTGLTTYPGAHPKSDSDHDQQRANINIGGEDFGVKVIVAKYVTDDPPDKVIDFYRKDMKRYGKVIECPKGIKETHGDDDGEITCDDHGSSTPGKLDMAVGVPKHQHVVSIKPDGKGTEFSLVYVQVRGKDKESM